MPRTQLSLFEGEFRRYKRIGEDAFSQLDEDQVQVRQVGGNSVATIVWHVAGNLRSRFTDFLTTDGEKPWRARETEFEVRTPSSVELRERWEGGWQVLTRTLAGLVDADLARTVTIRGIESRVDEALLRSLAHVSYHVGQIVYVGKDLKGAAWRYLSIPPGQSESYLKNPYLEKPDGPRP